MATYTRNKATDEVVRHDAINHPAHYSYGKYEVIDVIEDWGLNFNRGNAVKYIARAGKKDPLKEAEDLKKAVFYLTHEIDRLEETQNGSD